MCSRLALVGLVLFVSFSANAAEKVINPLTDFFNKLDTLTADFEQEVHNSQLSSTEKASGKLWIDRPGKFRWNYVKPYEQQIVSDGKKLWVYDKDLEQVTVKPVNASMGNTPAVLLSDSKPITDTFRINVIGEKSGLNWIELLPLDEDAGFTAIRLGFKKKTLKEMLLEDNLGQRTRLSFSGLKKNKKLDTALFDFTPPDGVDVFETAE